MTTAVRMPEVNGYGADEDFVGFLEVEFGRYLKIDMELILTFLY